MTPFPLVCTALLFFAIALAVFLFAVAIARAARDIEPVDDGRGYGGDDQ